MKIDADWFWRTQWSPESVNMNHKLSLIKRSIETFCPICNDYTMEKIFEGRYRCIKCGLTRLGNPERNLIVVYDRVLPEYAIEKLYHMTKDKKIKIT